MRIIINGEARDIAAGETLASLAAAWPLDLARAAVEVNRVIIPRSLHQATVFADGDAVEIVQFIGGG